MRKLKLQMQMSLDGRVATPTGELDWMTWNWDEGLKQYVSELTNSMDTILMGRKMTDGFVSHWESVMKNPNDPMYAAAKIFVETPKVVFTKTLDQSKWSHTTLAKGELSEEIAKLKQQSGKDLMAYGGAGFVSNLVRHNLIDEYYLFVNPVILGKGLSIFENVEKRLKLKMVESRKFDCGIVLLRYQAEKE